MKHRFAYAGRKQNDRGNGDAVHKEQGQEAGADAERGCNQHRPPADAVGYAADQRRRQQLAACIAAEQQAIAPTGMPASLLAQSGKKGISAPSAKPAQKNSRSPNRAGRGAARQEEGSMLIMTSPAHGGLTLVDGQGFAR